MPERFFWLANGLYFGVCFVHERYMVLVALLLVALALKGEDVYKRQICCFCGYPRQKPDHSVRIP